MILEFSFLHRYWDKNGYLRGSKLEFQKWIIFFKYFFSFECFIFFFINSIFFSYIWKSFSWIFSRLVLRRITTESFLFSHWIFVELATRKERQHIMPSSESAFNLLLLLKFLWSCVELKRSEESRKSPARIKGEMWVR